MKDVIYVGLVWSTNRKFYKHYNLFDEFRKMARCRKCCTSHQDIAAMGNLINWYVVLPPQPKPTAWHFAFRFWFLSQFWINDFSKKQLLLFPLIMPASSYGTNTEAKTENGLGNFGAKLSLEKRRQGGRLPPGFDDLTFRSEYTPQTPTILTFKKEKEFPNWKLFFPARAYLWWTKHILLPTEALCTNEGFISIQDSQPIWPFVWETTSQPTHAENCTL